MNRGWYRLGWSPEDILRIESAGLKGLWPNPNYTWLLGAAVRAGHFSCRYVSIDGALWSKMRELEWEGKKLIMMGTVIGSSEAGVSLTFAEAPGVKGWLPVERMSQVRQGQI